MGQADAQEPAVFFYIQAFSEIQGVVVAVAGENAAIAESSSKLERSVVRDADSKSRTAAVELRGIGDAVEGEAGNFQQATNHNFRKAALVLLNGAIRSQQCGAPGGDGRVNVATQIGEIVHAGSDSGDAFMI